MYFSNRFWQLATISTFCPDLGDFLVTFRDVSSNIYRRKQASLSCLDTSSTNSIALEGH